MKKIITIYRCTLKEARKFAQEKYPYSLGVVTSIREDIATNDKGTVTDIQWIEDTFGKQVVLIEWNRQNRLNGQLSDYSGK